MKKAIVMLPILMLLVLATAAAGKTGVEVAEQCGQCGMSRSMFSYSRMLITYRNGAQSAVCSLHCAAVELSKAKDKNGAFLQVADYESNKLIPAEGAVWVMGGSKTGVMTAQPKWAFASRSEAKRFVKLNGGRIVSFKEAMKAAAAETRQEAIAPKQLAGMKWHRGRQAL